MIELNLFPSSRDRNQTTELSAMKVEEIQQVLGTERQDLGYWTAGTNTKLVLDQSNKSKINQLEETEEREQVEEAIRSSQSIRYGEIGKRLVIAEGELEKNEGVRILKRNLRVVVVEDKKYKTWDRKKRKKSHVILQEAVMIDRDREDLREIIEEILELPTFEKTTRDKTKILWKQVI